MQTGNGQPFPFMELPPELRDMVYENLLEDPYYPPPPPCAKHHGSPLNWMLNLTGAATPHKTHTHAHGRKKSSNWIFLANKQIYAEYMDIVCKKTTFHLTVSPHNYAAPVAPMPTPMTTTTTIITTTSTPAMTHTSSSTVSTVPLSSAGTPTPAAEVRPTKPKKIWNISPHTLKQLRKCDIKLITTSNMLGVNDPRTMKPEDWALARQIREELKEVENVQELNLHVKAIGDPLWNPLWVWYHASQSLKTMGCASPTAATTTTGPPGPKLNRITFSLDMWSPGENYLERDPENKNQWAWRCMKGHCVGQDTGPETTVREFCARLYMECRTCRPELDSDDELEEE